MEALMKRTTKTYNQLYPCSLSGDHYQLNQMYTQPTIQQKYILYIKNKEIVVKRTNLLGLNFYVFGGYKHCTHAYQLQCPPWHSLNLKEPVNYVDCKVEGFWNEFIFMVNVN